MKKHLLTLLTALFSCTIGHAQFLVNPMGYQAIYPFAPQPYMGGGHTSCYHYASAPMAGTTIDFYVTGTNGAYDGITWQAMNPGSTSPAILQGTIPMPGMMDIEVGSVIINGSPAIIVAYYSPGIGHFIDVYECLAGSTSYSLTSSMQVSTATTYTRISADFHKGYGIVAAWEDHGAIKTIFGTTSGTSISWSSVLTLAGTNGGHDVDVAFTHVMTGSTSQPMHYVYRTYSPSAFKECEADWGGMLYGSSPYPTTLQDVLLIPSNNTSLANIDCPDHNDVDNWAYTFTSAANYEYSTPGILVRLVDYHTSPTPKTTNVTNGSLGNLPMSTANWVYDMPTLSYEQDGNSMYVGWYAEQIPAMPNFGSGHVCIQMDKYGTILQSAPDYLIVSNTATQNAPLALSKMNDYLVSSQYEYATFYNSIPADVVQHAWHQRGTFAFWFRASHGSAPDACGPESLLANSKALNAGVQLYPNPFTSTINWKTSGDWSGKRVTVDVHSIAGTAIHLPESSATEAAAALNQAVRSLVPGVYFISITPTDTHRSQIFSMTKR